MKLDYEKVQIAGADKKMTVTQMLKAAKMSPTTMQRIRHGQNINMRSAGNLAEALGVSVRDLL